MHIIEGVTMNSFKGLIHKDLIEEELKYSEVYRYLDKYMDDSIYSVTESFNNQMVKENSAIWIFWMQGMEHAPKLVKKCFESVCKNKPEGFDIILLSDKNLSEYIRMPEFIIEKYKKGYISTTHFSDLVRLELLSSYGGCWIDATVFCSGRIPIYMLSGEMFLFKASMMDNVVIKISNWWLASNKSNRIIHAAKNILYTFWKNENVIVNYYLFHIIMSKLIDEDYQCNAIFRNIYYFNNSNPHVLQGKMGTEFNEKEWEVIKDISVVHKLTYKKKYIQGDLYNYYQALIDGRI